MSPIRLLNLAILPALAELSRCGIPDTMDARRFMLAIALQESGLAHRRQVVGDTESGPAASFWQFEQGGGCKGVLNHYLVASTMRNLCVDFNIEATPAGLWEAMRYHDIVAAIAARLLLYTLPSKLATTAADGWAQYTAAWRPGRPHPDKWQSCWDVATLTTGAK
ncbi:hypothetical protein SAMN05428966_102115 [Massilia sp. PDC64]|nr:hypothetical protein [Massilia sp. PDC64]SDC68687.1 hypothetical protein SAMN05428966_102115 [Massilia sp. PDC64]